jgi:hypothetical protein
MTTRPKQILKTFLISFMVLVATPLIALSGDPAGPVVGNIEVTIDSAPMTFDIIGGMRAGTGWAEGQHGPTINLMGVRTDGSGNRLKIRFPIRRDGNDLVCDVMSTRLEYYVDKQVYRMRMGPDCAPLKLDEVKREGHEGPIRVSGTFAGRFGGLGANEKSYAASEGAFGATVDPFR